MFKNVLIATGLAGLVLAAQPALAQTTSGAAAPLSASTDVVVNHRLVEFADLDLSTAAGQTKFDARLRRAAAAVCEANYGPHPLSEAMEARRCYRNALQSAQRTIAARAASQGMARMASR